MRTSLPVSPAPRLLILIPIGDHIHHPIVYDEAMHIVCWWIGLGLAVRVGACVEHVLPVVRCRGRRTSRETPFHEEQLAGRGL
jgi:hypothetical protein